MKSHSAGLNPAKTTATAMVEDGGESVGLMEPLILAESSPHRSALSDIALTLASRSARLLSSLPDGIVTALAGLVRSMSCYYRNLIVGARHAPDRHRARAEEGL